MGTVSDFSGDSVGPKTQKQGGVDLTDVCKIRFLMAGSRRLVLLGRRPAPGLHRWGKTTGETHAYRTTVLNKTSSLITTSEGECSTT